MLHLQAERVGTGRAVQYTSRGPGALGFREVLSGCTGDAALRSALIEVLAQAPFSAYFWETPPLEAASFERPFEFVLTEAPGLASASPEPDAFSEHFDSATAEGVVSFTNLGGDATLVVPTPLTDLSVYTHLAAFMRGGPIAQQHALLQRVAALALAQPPGRPRWVSTAGMGVYWLHVRIDSRPKYYRHGPYTQPARA